MHAHYYYYYFYKPEVAGTMTMTLTCRVKILLRNIISHIHVLYHLQRRMEPQHLVIFQADAEGKALKSPLLQLLLVMMLFCGLYLSWMSDSTILFLCLFSHAVLSS